MSPANAAATLTDLLAERHTKDLFVPQCKTGPTHYAPAGGLSILDAWAMAKSWANPVTFGYEIKVSRSDFLSDQKWQGYLEFCSDFYFVCPPGLIDPQELPAEVGLMVASTNLKRLYVKRKAVRREVEIPESLYRYVLMWRAEVKAERNGQVGNLEYWQRWLEKEDEKRKTGHHVRAELARLTGERILEAERESARVRERIRDFERLEGVLRELDIDPLDWNAERRLRERVAEIRGAIPKDLLADIERAEVAMRGLRERLGAKSNDGTPLTTGAANGTKV